jgi:hypothetical protein
LCEKHFVTELLIPIWGYQIERWEFAHKNQRNSEQVADEDDTKIIDFGASSAYTTVLFRDLELPMGSVVGFLWKSIFACPIGTHRKGITNAVDHESSSATTGWFLEEVSATTAITATVATAAAATTTTTTTAAASTRDNCSESIHATYI